jgi:hypothetical protein
MWITNYVIQGVALRIVQTELITPLIVYRRGRKIAKSD